MTPMGCTSHPDGVTPGFRDRHYLSCEILHRCEEIACCVIGVKPERSLAKFAIYYCEGKCHLSMQQWSMRACIMFNDRPRLCGVFEFAGCVRRKATPVPDSGVDSGVVGGTGRAGICLWSLRRDRAATPLAKVAPPADVGNSGLHAGSSSRRTSERTWID